jgi:hypothetical protein
MNEVDQRIAEGGNVTVNRVSFGSTLDRTGGEG